MAFTQRIYLNSSAQIDLFTITHDVHRVVSEAGIKNGLVTVVVPLSDGGVTVLENDPAIHRALRDLIVQLVPEQVGKRPDRRSKTGPLYAHLRALLLGSTLTCPIIAGALGLGHWQEIVVYDFDTRVARRECIIHVIGDGEPKDAQASARVAGGRRSTPTAAGKTLPPGKARIV